MRFSEGTLQNASGTGRLTPSKGALERIQLVLDHPSRQGRRKGKKLKGQPVMRDGAEITSAVSRTSFSLRVPLQDPPHPEGTHLHGPGPT